MVCLGEFRGLMRRRLAEFGDSVVERDGEGSRE